MPYCLRHVTEILKHSMVHITGSSDDLIGATLGHFVVQAAVTDSVYQGYDTESGRPVVIKMMPVDYDHREAFLATNETLTAILHPHVLPFMSVSEFQDRVYIVTPLIQGTTLRDRLDGELLPYTDIARIVGQIALALDYIHDRGLLHGNLRPSNIFFDAYNNLYVAEFGLPTPAVGAYAAPEVWRGDPLDRRTDVFSLGVLLFQLVTGGLPFTEDALRDSFLYEPPNPARPSDDNPLADVIMKALAQNADERYARAGDLAKAVNERVQPAEKLPRDLPASRYSAPDWKVLWEPAQEGEWHYKNPSAVQGCVWLGEAFLAAGDDGCVYRWENGVSKLVAQTSSTILSLSVDDARQKIATAHADGVVRVWDMRGGLLHILRGHEGEVLCCSLAGDGLMLASGGEDGTLRIWDLLRGEVDQVLLHGGAVMDCSMNINGQLVLSACADHILRLWHTQNGQVLQAFTGHQAVVTACELKGELVLSGAADGVLRVWDILMEDAPVELRGHTGAITACHIRDVEGVILGVSTAQDGEMRLWDLRKEEMLRLYDVEHVLLMCCALDDNYVLAGDSMGGLHVYTHQVSPAPRRHTGRVMDSWLDTGVVLSVGYDGILHQTALGSGEHLLAVKLAARSQCITVAEGFVFTGGADGYIRCFDDQRLRWEARAHYAEINFVLGLDEKRIVSGGADGQFCIWNLVTGVRIIAVKPNSANIRCGLVHKDLVIIGTREGEVSAWDAASGKRQHVFGKLAYPVMLCSRGSHVLMAGLADGVLAQWDVESRREIGIFQAHPTLITALAVHPDGHIAVSADADGAVHVWDLAAQTRLDRWQADHVVTHLRWLDTHRLLVGDDSGGLRCYSRQ